MTSEYKEPGPRLSSVNRSRIRGLTEEKSMLTGHDHSEMAAVIAVADQADRR
jgi:hypothetical protein